MILDVLLSGCRTGSDGTFTTIGDEKNYRVEFEYFEKEISPGNDGMFDNVPSQDEKGINTVAFNVTGIIPDREVELMFTEGTIMVIPDTELKLLLDFQNDIILHQEKQLH